MSKRIITLGTWDGKPIEWIVLRNDKVGTLVISKNSLFNSYFDNDSNDWKKSNIRKYLNNAFYNKAFSEIDKKNIINAKLEDVNDSKDNVFILSKTEAETLLKDEERKIGTEWLLRSPHSSKNTSIWFVENSGKFCYFQGYNINQKMGVVVALYIMER